MKNLKLAIVCCIFCIGFASAQTQRERYDASVKAYESKDYKTFLKLTKTLDSIRPFHPTYTYNLASANALNGNSEEALMALRTLVLMNNTVDFESDADFASLKQDGGFTAILNLKKDQGKLIATSKPVVTLSEKELHPEGLTYLPKAKLWLATSIRKRKIITFDSTTGQCRDWLKGNTMLSVLAMKADTNEQFLWVATAAFAEMENYDKALEGKAEVLKVDIATKQIVKRFTVEGSHVFGDVIVAKNGVVYVSDSGKPIVYKIEKDAISEFVSFENDGYNLQGLAFNDTQDRLFVADYLKGIAVIGIRNQSTSWLAFPDYATAKGIDGLVFYKNSLIGIQNGVKPIRITQFKLNDQQTEISDMEFIVDKEAKTVHITREFGAGRDLVWDAWTNTEILDQWWAPKPFASRTKEMDFKVGGRRLYAMVSPEGGEKWGTWDFTAINPKYHFKFFALFTDAEGNPNTDIGASDWDVNFSGDDETTTVNVVITRDSFEELEKLVEMGFKTGFTAALQNLENVLASKK